jgi:hypothetical protein
MDLYELIRARTVATDSKAFNIRWYVNEPTAIFLSYEVEGKRRHVRLDLDEKDIEMLKEFINYHNH